VIYFQFIVIWLLEVGEYVENTNNGTQKESLFEIATKIYYYNSSRLRCNFSQCEGIFVKLFLMLFLSCSFS